MTLSMAERNRLAVLGWLATVATSLSLFPALQEKRYFILGAALSALVVAIGVAFRYLHLPTLVAPLVQTVVVVELLLVTYGHHTAYGVLPTPTTLTTVQDTLSAGFDVAQRYSAPVPPSAGLTLMTIGFIAFVAIVVDLLAAGLGRAPLAGLPLLALYSVPVASLPDGVPAIVFIPGAAAYLALLMVSERERLAHWGRHVARTGHTDRNDTIDTSGLTSAGRRLSVYAIATAVVLPLLVPTFTHTLFHGQAGLGNGDGTRLSFSDPMVSLATSLHQKAAVDLIDVTTDTPPSYLRLAVLNDPGPNAWTNSDIRLDATLPTDQRLPAPTGLSPDVARVARSMNVGLASSFPRDSVWLPVPYAVTSMNLDIGFGGQPDDFGYVTSDQTVTSRASGALSHVQNYSVSYDQVEPTEGQLVDATPAPADIVTNYEKVPAGVPAVVGEDARNVTANATNDYQRALDLQSFFRDSNDFTYDLNTGYGYGYQAMAKFLQVRRGFCQHFAATMAMMAREIGIPSRVVVGFLNPTRLDSNGTYVFTSHDAHAWPELYFGGVGWVRFEPTPGNGAAIPPYTHTVQVPPIQVTKPTQSQGGIIGHTTGDVPTTSAAVLPNNGAGSGSNGGGVPPLAWLVVILAALLLLTPGAIRWGVRRSRLARAIDGGESCEYAWLELQRPSHRPAAAVDRIAHAPSQATLRRAAARRRPGRRGGTRPAQSHRGASPVRRITPARRPAGRRRARHHRRDRARHRLEAARPGVPLAPVADARAAARSAPAAQPVPSRRRRLALGIAGQPSRDASPRDAGPALGPGRPRDAVPAQRKRATSANAE